MADWYYDDLRQVGLDFEDPAAVASYDRNQGTSRAEDVALLDRLGVPEDALLVDLGCGTGSFVVAAAARCRQAIGVDVSAEMLAQAKARAAQAGVRNLTFVRGGFLSYRHEAPPADFVTTKFALHHLPDFWKAVALLRINAMLRPGGKFFLRDVIFSFEPAAYEAEIEAWIGRVAAADGQGFTRADFAQHVREEHSSFAWIIEGLIARAGFAIEAADREDPAYTDYLCVKTRVVEPIGR